MKVRRRARIAVLQALFEVDIVHHDAGVALGERLEASPLPAEGTSFAGSVLRGVLEHRNVLDAIIQQIAPEWPIDQVSPIDRNILRMAAFEILYKTGTPPKVAVNEAVELAKLFGSDSSSRFVNGVLGTLLANRDSLLSTVGVSRGPDADSKGLTGSSHEDESRVRRSV